MAGISLKITAGPAYREIAKLERTIGRLQKNKGAIKRKVTERLRKVVAKSVEIHVAETWDYLMEQTPYWSGYLVSNWDLSQGREPPAGALPNKASKWDDFVETEDFQLPQPGQFAASELDISNIDGTKYQVIYNNTSYAEEVAQGIGPSKKNDYKIISGGGPDWFLVSGSFFSSPSVYRRHFRQASRDVNLG